MQHNRELSTNHRPSSRPHQRDKEFIRLSHHAPTASQCTVIHTACTDCSVLHCMSGDSYFMDRRCFTSLYASALGEIYTYKINTARCEPSLFLHPSTRSQEDLFFETEWVIHRNTWGNSYFLIHVPRFFHSSILGMNARNIRTWNNIRFVPTVPIFWSWKKIYSSANYRSCTRKEKKRWEGAMGEQNNTTKFYQGS